MAVWYVRSTTGSDANSGITNWGNAFATIAKALSVAAAGDTVYVSQVHAETQASAMTWTSPGTAGSLVMILCVNDAAAPPTAMATTATVTTTGSSAINFGAGCAYVYGISFSCGTGSTAANTNFNTNNTFCWILDTCKLTLATTSAARE